MTLGLVFLRGLMRSIVHSEAVRMLLGRGKIIVWVVILIVFGLLGVFTDDKGQFRNYKDIVSCPPSSSCGC